MESSTKKKNMATALLQYFKTGEETHLTNDVASIVSEKGLHQSDFKKIGQSTTEKESSPLRATGRGESEGELSHKLTTSQDEVIKAIVANIGALKEKAFDMVVTYLDDRVTVIGIDSKRLVKTFEGTSKIRITKVDEDQYKVETESYDPHSFRELVRCSPESLVGVVEGIISSIDQS